jgi:3-oxoacyl-[acyl-carrier protein] reductase
MRLEDQVVIVTGGAQGIGFAYCERLGQEGARVVVADINGERAEAAAARLRQAETEAFAVPMDVTRVEDTERLARATLERFGRIDALINNAAMYQRPAVTRGPFEELPVEEWDRLMAVNLRGVFLCARAVVPSMKQQRRGKIVNISSGTVFSGTPWFAHYVTSKAGVIGFTRVLAKELGEWNINVNAIAPGLTQSLDEADVDQGLMEYHENRARQRSVKRLETPQDLVGAAAFLCSPDSDFMTGQTLVVDGGYAFN